MAISYLPKDTLKDFLYVLKCFQNTLSSTHYLLSFTKAVKLPSALFKCLWDVDLTVLVYLPMAGTSQVTQVHTLAEP